MVDREETLNDDPGTPITRNTYNWGAIDPSTAVIETVAAVAGCDPMALGPLTEHVEPDALDSLVRTANERTTVRFHYASYLVTVSGDGEITVQRMESTESH